MEVVLDVYGMRVLVIYGVVLELLSNHGSEIVEVDFQPGVVLVVVKRGGGGELLSLFVDAALGLILTLSGRVADGVVDAGGGSASTTPTGLCCHWRGTRL